MSSRTAVFPGSFDPLTLGHIDIVRRGLSIFDRIVIGIGNNSQKKYMYPIEKREQWIRKVFHDNANVEVAAYSGLTIDFCKKVNSQFILRGLRTSADFEFEKAIALTNSQMAVDLETVFILSDLKYAALSSSIVRDVIRNGGSVSLFVPEVVSREL
jgi:pantetheine-phosphate adenylyltransferase